MLVFARYAECPRHPAESGHDGFVIHVPPGEGRTVHVRVLETVGNKVRVGVEAGPEVRVFRDEVEAERQRLAGSAGRPA